MKNTASTSRHTAVRSRRRKRRLRSWLKRLRLRARVVVLFTFGAALVASALVVLTYGLTRESLLNQRQESSQAQFFANARQVQASLRSESPDFAVLLESLPSLAGSRPIVWTGSSTWRAPSLTPDELPDALIDTVTASPEAFNMRYRQEGAPQLALGLRLRPDPVSQLQDVAYFEVVPLAEIENTLGSLRVILIAGAAITTLLGAGIGVFASQRLLRPLSNISAAATSIAEGHFNTRVAPSEDPDLAQITLSFNEMAASMARRIDRDARFASDVSHELRSPLQTLRSSIEVLMRRRHELSERSATALDLLAGDVDRLERLVKDLLEISQADSAEDSLHLSLVNMAQLVRHSVDSLETQADIKVQDLSLTIEPGADRALVMGDKRRLVQILDNLLRNAEKYGDGVIRVEMSVVNADSDRNRLLIAVEDNGPGVTPSEREIVFERFARGAVARKRASTDGAGLGLALVHEHVHSHGGSSFVEGKPDGSRGARFVVLLPMAGPEAAHIDHADIDRAAVNREPAR